MKKGEETDCRVTTNSIFPILNSNRKMKKLSKFIYTQLLGWRVANMQPDIPKCILAVAPHTSNWDFVIGKLAYASLGRNARFLIKKEWFVFPFNLFFRCLGGIPVNRNKKTSMTDALAAEFARRERLQIAVTPEGTRKRVSEWKRGFYFIALKAGIPIVLVGLDYKKKEAVFLNTFYPTGNVDEDMAKIQSHYKGIEGKHPKKFNL